jgi:hypothetical protein
MTMAPRLYRPYLARRDGPVLGLGISLETVFTSRRPPMKIANSGRIKGCLPRCNANHGPKR